MTPDEASVPLFRAPRLIFGRGAVAELSQELRALSVRQPMLLTDDGLVEAGHSGAVTAQFQDGVTVATVGGRIPTYAAADIATQTFKAHRCDALIALGGGSVIDTAKAVAVMSRQGGRAVDYVENGRRIAPDVSPLVAIPTTTGTGSEASPDAGLHPDENQISKGITSPHIIPLLAICDPDLTVSLPAWMRSATAIDALSHCVEGFLSVRADDIQKRAAAEGTRLVCQSIRPACLQNDLHAQSELMYGAYLGGIAIGGGLGAAHALAISCSDRHIHHGMLSGIGLIICLRHIEEAAPETTAAVAAILPGDGSTPPSLFVRKLILDLGLPANLRSAGYQFTPTGLAQACADSHFNRSSPCPPTAEDFSRLLAWTEL